MSFEEAVALARSLIREDQRPAPYVCDDLTQGYPGALNAVAIVTRGLTPKEARERNGYWGAPLQPYTGKPRLRWMRFS